MLGSSLKGEAGTPAGVAVGARRKCNPAGRDRLSRAAQGLRARALPYPDSIRAHPNRGPTSIPSASTTRASAASMSARAWAVVACRTACRAESSA